jgi:hypothetical protein
MTGFDYGNRDTPLRDEKPITPHWAKREDTRNRADHQEDQAQGRSIVLRTAFVFLPPILLAIWHRFF